MSSACQGKTRYLSRGDAKRVAADRRRKGDPMNVYHCGRCSLWHLGHNQGTGTRNDARYGSRRVQGYDAYVECPACKTFTARVGVSAAKCETCGNYVLPGGH